MSGGVTRVLCDWGGSRLRAFLESGGAVSDRRLGPGINLLDGEPPARALARALASWTGASLRAVFVCGMAGSRNGLIEVPYARAPVAAAQWRCGGREMSLEELSVTIAPGVQAQNFRDVPDVMRGEETQIFGALALHRELAEGRRLFVLPGTHSKWVEVRDGRIARLQTFFTGELYDVLCRHSSLLRVGDGLADDDDAFDVGVRNAARHDLAASLFETRSAQLVEGRSASWARSFLSGLLIGAEVHSMLPVLRAAPAPLTLIGEPALTTCYLRALATHADGAVALDGDACVLAGLRLFAGDAAGT